MDKLKTTDTAAKQRLLRFSQPVSLDGGDESPGKVPWKLLIVDDDTEIHSLTRMVLRTYEFDGRPLDLLSAYSAAEARKILAEHSDVAVLLLDVVMETEDSGLRLVQHIRGELRNSQVRIILRTGQPGQAPEMDVVAHYDINDYKAKVDLTSGQLVTSVTSALRAWRDILTIELSRQGLQQVVEASGRLYSWESRTEFSRVVLRDLVELAAGRNPVAAPLGVSGLVARRVQKSFCVIDGVGQYAGFLDRQVNEVVPDHTGLMVCRASRRGEGLFFNHSYVCCLKADNGEELLFLIQGTDELAGVENNLLRVYMANVASSFHNINLSLEVIESQKELIDTLGGMLESRSLETAEHVQRVGEMASLLALKAGLSVADATTLRLAAPLHDVGKVGVPDAILNKPGRLTASEFEIMKSHAVIGSSILSRSERPLMRAAALIAAEHHERWDGSGYPAGKCGEEIHIYGRITALVDVFDAMISDRIYRPGMELGAVLTIIRENSGKHFDPKLVAVFLEYLTDFVAIIRANPDDRAVPPAMGCRVRKEEA